MKNLALFNDNNFLPEGYTVRKVVRAVILNEKETEVLFFGNGSLLVGGGVEEGESYEDALRRETMEEVGANIEIISEVGEVVAYRDFSKQKYIVQGYICKIVGSLVKPTTTQFEEKITVPVWQSIPYAISNLENKILEIEKAYLNKPKDDKFQQKVHNRKTSIAFLKETQLLLNK